MTKCLIKDIQQTAPDRIVFVQFPEYTESHASRGHKIAGRLVDLHDFRLAHQDRFVPDTEPTVQSQDVRGAVAPAGWEQNLLVISIDALIGTAVNVGQRLRVDELTGIPDREKESHGRLPIDGRREGSAQGEILARFTPAGAGFYDWPDAVIYVRGSEGFITRVKTKGRQGLASPVDKRFDQFQATGDLGFSQADAMQESLPTKFEKGVFKSWGTTRQEPRT